MKRCTGFEGLGLAAYANRKHASSTRGVTQVCFSAYLPHRRNSVLALRRFEKGFLRSRSFSAYKGKIHKLAQLFW